MASASANSFRPLHRIRIRRSWAGSDWPTWIGSASTSKVVAAANEMRRCINELGFVGTFVTGSCGGLFLDDERFDPVLTAAEEVDLPIYVHPGPHRH